MSCVPQYAMICGHAPFYGQSASTEEIMLRIQKGQFSFESSEWSSVSQAAKSIIEGRYTVIHEVLIYMCSKSHT